MPKLLEILNKTTDFFKQKGVPNAKLDAELIIAHILRCQRLQLYLQFEREMEEITLEKIRPLVKRRGDREPLQYIIGEVEWGNLKLKVDKNCLIPRHETEELWEMIGLEYKSSGKKPARILDLGTGSGALALALKKSFPSSEVVAVERSAETLQLALENAQANKLEVNFVEGSWFDHVEGKFDLIVSNPPYLTEKEWESAEPEVKKYEPKAALVAASVGFADIETIIRDAGKFLNAGGQLWLEMGIDHAQHVREFSKDQGFERVNIIRDRTERNRFAQLVV